MTNQAAESMSMHTEGRGRWLGLAMLSLGVAMIIVDATIVNVAVPSIIRDLKLDSTAAEWVNAIYTLVFAALLVTLGRMGDVLGRRAMYLAGLVLFVLASMVAGVASSGEMLIGARLVQGLGGAMILPATQSILNANFRGRDRAIAFGIWGAVIGGMAAIGPLLGGWLTTNLSWRWAFFLNLPVGILAVIGTLVYIRESRDEDSRLGFDLPGFILITLGLGGVVFGLIEGRTYGWWGPNANHPFAVLGWSWPLASISIVPIAIGVGVVAILLFTIIEIRRQRAGKFFLFDFSLWGFRAFRYGNLAGTIVSLGEFGLLFALPLFLQGVIGYSAFETGLAFLALALGSFAAAPLAVSVARSWGPRRAVTLGMSLEAVGILVTTFLIGRDTSGLLLAAPLFVYGIGVGLATAQLTSIVLSEIPGSRSGLASGTNSTMRQVGSALGVAILGTVLFAALVGGSSRQPRGVAPRRPGSMPRADRVAGRRIGGPDPAGPEEPVGRGRRGVRRAGDARAGPGSLLRRPGVRGGPAAHGGSDRGRVRLRDPPGRLHRARVRRPRRPLQRIAPGHAPRPRAGPRGRGARGGRGRRRVAPRSATSVARRIAFTCHSRRDERRLRGDWLPDESHDNRADRDRDRHGGHQRDIDRRLDRLRREQGRAEHVAELADLPESDRQLEGPTGKSCDSRQGIAQPHLCDRDERQEEQEPGHPVRQLARIEQHADGDEEQDREDIPEWQQPLPHLRRGGTLGDRGASNERGQGEGHAEADRPEPGEDQAGRDGDDEEQVRLVVQGVEHARQEPRRPDRHCREHEEAGQRDRQRPPSRPQCREEDRRGRDADHVLHDAPAEKRRPRSMGRSCGDGCG